MISRIKKAIREEIATTENKLCNGNFSDYTGAKTLAERRLVLLKVIEIINEVSKEDEDDIGIE